VQPLDALANATDVKRVEVEAVMAAHPAARGNPRLLRVLPLMDAGAELPQETIARLVLVDAGLPSPVTQFRVFDEYGQFVARLDMAYDDVTVGRVRRGSTLDRSRGATARYRQAVRPDGARLVDRPRQQRFTALSTRRIRRESS
jgi:hypothetical protein